MFRDLFYAQCLISTLDMMEKYTIHSSVARAFQGAHPEGQNKDKNEDNLRKNKKKCLNGNLRKTKENESYPPGTVRADYAP